MLLSGEILRPRLVRRWRAVIAAGPRLMNLYGPTESTVIKLRYPIPASCEIDGDSVPIGTPSPIRTSS